MKIDFSKNYFLECGKYIAVFFFRVHKTIKTLYQICTRTDPPSWGAVEELGCGHRQCVWMFCQVFCTRACSFSVPCLDSDAQIPCE